MKNILKLGSRWCLAAIFSANSLAFGAIPVITGFSPASGSSGTPVTIAGANFGTAPSNNIVYFGAVRATVTSANQSNLLVTVPSGATYAPVTVTVGGLVAYSGQPFQPGFAGSPGISTSTFAPAVNVPTSAGPSRIAIGDLNGDGKPDFVVASIYANTISIYQNLGTGGPLGGNSFASPIIIPFGSGDNPYWITLADVDGDGRLDIVVPDQNNNVVTVFRNVSSGGALSAASFASPVSFTVGSHPREVVVRDLDGDGRPDIAVANIGDDTISILKNIGAVGSITSNSFAAQIVLAAGSQPHALAVGDLDRDGKPDLAVGNYTSPFVSLFRNVSVAGTLNSNSFAARVDLPANYYCNSIVLGDLDGDGRLDIVCGTAEGASAVSVFHNVSNPGVIDTNSFEARVDFASGGWVSSVALGDLDGDGRLDILSVTQIGNAFSVYPNQSVPGTFTSSSLGSRVDFPSGSNPYSVSVCDLNGDGRPDVLFANFYDGTLTFYQTAASVFNGPTITSQPTNQTVSAGGIASFSVTATGSPTLHYQWYGPGTSLIAGAINPTLTLSNVQPSNAGSYFVLVTNLFGFAQSSNAVLTVSGGGGGTNTCTPPASGLAAWWPAEGNGNDIAGGNTALLESGVTFAAGKVGQAFQLQNPTNAFMHVPASPSLNVGAGSGLTIEGWINVSSVSGFHPIAEWYGDVRNNVGVQLWLNSNPSQSGALLGALPDTNLVPHTLVSPAGILIPNVFQHVAMTYDQASGIGTLYVNGAVVAQQNLGSFVPQTTYDLWIGHRPFDVPGDWTYGTYLGGMLDELSIYGRALSSDEIAAIYNAGSAGKCTVNHSPIADATATASLVISPNGSNATVVLDGSLSSDPDGDPLQYSWFEGNAPAQVASGVVAVVTLPIGTNSITLSVSDGANSNRQTIAVEVITATEAVTRLTDLVDTNVAKAQALAATLSAAIKSIDKSNPNAAINQLQAFQNQVLAQIAPLDPDLADSLISDAQEVIDALTGVVPKGNEKNAALIRNQNGKAQVQFAGAHGNTYIIEASSDMVHWEKIGVAREPSVGAFEFEDTTAPSKSMRFYRVVVP